MPNKMVHIRMPDKLYKESKALADDFGFSSVQEFFRSAVRKAVGEYQRQMAWRTVKALYGSDRNLKKPTRKERDRWAREFMEKVRKGYDPFRL